MKKNYTDMKKFNIKLIGIVLIFSILLFGCKKWIDPDMNIDPDQPSDVPMEYLVTSIESTLGFIGGGNTSVRTTNIWMQLFDGTARQSFTEARYTLTSADVNDLWDNMYAQTMMDCYTLINKAGEKESPYYAGVGKVCMAASLGIITNLYGDIPYTEAFQGSENLQPAYNSQQEIYGIIDQLLTDAVNDLGSDANAVDLAGDFIYDNDVSQWIKAANALHARFSLYQKKYDDAISYADKAMTSNDDDFEVPFEDTPTGSNPLNQFMADRGDVRMCSTFINELVNTNDPRLPFYAGKAPSGDYVGSNPGSANAATSEPGDFVAASDAPTRFATFMEMNFIKAESYFKKGDKDNALTAYKDAVTASLMKVTGEVDSTYNADFIQNETTGSLNMQKIIEQKYKADYGTVLPFDDWRRTGFPSFLQEVAGATRPTPTRFPYPQSEINYNSNCPVGVSINDKLWIFQ